MLEVLVFLTICVTFIYVAQIYLSLIIVGLWDLTAFIIRKMRRKRSCDKCKWKGDG